MASIYSKVSVAPMLAYTNRYARFFYRLLSPDVLLYTEMIHSMAVLSKKKHKYLEFNEKEHPVAVQLAGNCTKDMAQAAKICQDYGYDAINLNIGCPSNKVRQGEFGACLMESPQKVADIVAAITDAVDIPLSIKCRLGINKQIYQDTLPEFINITNKAGCSIYIIHARMAWLDGLNPKQNRDIPPLDYDFVYQIKNDFPSLNVTLNGGVTNTSQIKEHLAHVDSVMLGREVMNNPRVLQSIGSDIFNTKAIDITELIRHEYAEYAQKQLLGTANFTNLMRPILGLFYACPGGGIFRRRLAQRTDLWKDIPQAIDFALEALKPYDDE